MKRTFLMACALFLMASMALWAQSSEPLTLSYGNGVSSIEIYPNGYKLGSDATLVPYTGAYVLTGSASGDALSVNNGSGVKQTFDITFRDLTIQTGPWEGAVAITSETSTDTIVLNLYSSGTSRVCSGNHTALASRGDTEAPRIINLSVLDGTLTLENQHSAGGGFAWSSDYNTTFNLVNTVTIDGASSFTNSDKGSVTLKPKYQYTSNHDGTHQRTLGENSVLEDCSYRYEPVEGAESHRQVCIYCGYQTEPEPCIPSGEWIAKDEQYHGKICSLCGQDVSLEHHADLDNDHKCDYCGIIILVEPAQLENVYQIGNIAELYWFAALVNGTLEAVPQNTEAAAVLTADIVINEQVLTADGELVEDTDGMTVWTPIGGESASFKGTFDGQGHSISGLYINRPEADYQGLFGYIGSNGNVSRTEVTGSYIHGHNGVGGMTGYNYGTLTACSYSGTVIGYNYPLGGVAGRNNGTVSCCYATGRVHATGSNPYVGGVVGFNYGTISSCYSTASLSADHSGYIGGIASYNWDGYITGNYYLQGSADKGVDRNDGTVENVESRTAEQFAKGEVTWLLQHAITDDTQIWGQNLPADTLPVLLSEHRVYAALFIHEATDLQMTKYGNLNAQIPLPTAEELGVEGEVSFTDSFGNPLTETLTLLSDTVILVNCRLYSITVSDNILHGDISVSYDSCYAGAEVAVEANPYYGYELFMLHLTTSDGQHYEYEDEDFTFTMPAADVILSADFIPYLYDATYSTSENDNGYNVMLTWDYDASDCRTLIYSDGNLLHTTGANETSWQDQVSEAGVYTYTLYVVNTEGVRSRGTLLTVYAYPSISMVRSGVLMIYLGDNHPVLTDDGGRNGNYSNMADATAVITAYADCRIYLTGSYGTESVWDELSIYDSNNSLLGKYGDKGTIEPALLSSGNTLTVRFISDESGTNEGFELYVETVYPVTIAEVENGTVEADTAWARAGDMVTLTPLPNGQYAYVEGSLKVLKADYPTVEVPVNADGSFTMPAFKIIVTAAFESSTALSVTETAAWNVFGTDGMLHITGTEAEAEVYDVCGVLVYRGMERNLYLPTGVYIVRAEGQVQKAIVK